VSPTLPRACAPQLSPVPNRKEPPKRSHLTESGEVVLEQPRGVWRSVPRDPFKPNRHKTGPVTAHREAVPRSSVSQTQPSSEQPSTGRPVPSQRHHSVSSCKVPFTSEGAADQAGPGLLRGTEILRPRPPLQGHSLEKTETVGKEMGLRYLDP
jgi:hypothetical protein